jgi:hypothetical protein
MTNKMTESAVEATEAKSKKSPAINGRRPKEGIMCGLKLPVAILVPYVLTVAGASAAGAFKRSIPDEMNEALNGKVPENIVLACANSVDYAMNYGGIDKCPLMDESDAKRHCEQSVSEAKVKMVTACITEAVNTKVGCSKGQGEYVCERHIKPVEQK